MRSKSKVWDEMKTQPVRLKLRLAESGRSMAWLAAEVTDKGYKIARNTIWCVINKQYQTANHDRLVALIEETLEENGISTKDIWLELPGGEHKMRKIRPQYSAMYKKPGGDGEMRRRARSIKKDHSEEEEVAEVNYMKAFIPDEVLAHFGLEGDPFYDITDFTDVWVGPAHKVLERRVYDTVRRHGIMAIIGDIGAGKSTFLRYILTKMIGERSIRVIYPDRMNRRLLNGDSLTQSVIRELGAVKIPRNAVDRDALAKRLLEENVRMGTNPVLILDEAHDLQEEAFIALKRLWDSGMIFKLLSIILVGQGGVDSKHASYGLKHILEENPWIREFSERCYLAEVGGLGGSMRQYLDFRFRKAGGDAGRVFTDKAFHILAKKADVPQLANNVATRAMLLAYRDGKTQVEPHHVAGA